MRRLLFAALLPCTLVAVPPEIVLTEPSGGWTVDRMVVVAGRVNDPAIDPVTISINGGRYLVRSRGGTFRRSFPVTAGKNAIVVLGTNAGGTGRAERTLYAQIPTLPLSLALTSDTDGVYTDLHVYEPPLDAPDPETAGRDDPHHVFWASTSSPSGGRFYLNDDAGSFDSPGYGPYLYTHSAPPLGVFRVDANYWPGGDKAHTVATLEVVLFGGTPREIHRRVKLPLVTPGETQTLCFVRIDRDERGAVWVPSVDPRPADGSGWPAWAVAQGARPPVYPGASE